MIEDPQEASGNLLRRTTHGDDDAVMGSACSEVCLSQRLEIGAIMGQEGKAAVYGVSQLVVIAVLELSGFPGRRDGEAARTYEVRDQDIHVLIQVQRNEEIVHGWRTSGSINASGIRLRAM